MISDTAILDRIQKNCLIDKSTSSNIHNCTYILRVGSVFQPESGALEDTPPEVKPGSKPQHWIIGPTECLIVKTKEILNIPHDLCGYYAPLNRLAQKGIMLLNASVIEPGYSGPLSCFLVNFSSHDVEIAPEQEIAKITFHKLDEPLNNIKIQQIDDIEYNRSLAASARRYEKSFLGIGSIEERAKKAATDSVGASIKWGGIVVAVLILFAQLEPLFSKWIWEKAGVVTTTHRIDELKLEKDLEILDEKIKKVSEAQKEKLEINALQNKLEKIQTKLDAIENNTKSASITNK